jgi:putative transposase
MPRLRQRTSRRRREPAHDIPVTNPIESVFATVRHRTVRTKGSLSPTTARLMVFKLVMAASKTWRRLKGENQLPKVVAGVTVRDGTEVTESPSTRAA